MKKHHILTLTLILIASVGFGQTWNQQFNYRNIKFGNTTDGILQFNGLANFVNGINVPLRSLSDSTDNAASTKFVKQLVQGLGSPLTFGNGLTKTGNNVSLGGDYTNPISIGDLTEMKPSLVIAGSAEQGLKIARFGINNFQTGVGSYLSHNWVSGNPNDYEVSMGSSNSENKNRGISISNSSINSGISVSDFITNGGMFYVNDYSVGRTFPADNNWIPNAKYVNDAVTGAVSGNYIATNNGTGNNTTLNTPTITNGSANNMTVGLTSPTAGRFTALTATTTATVPTVATSDNSTNAASTAHVKGVVGIGQTIGANTTGSSNTANTLTSYKNVGTISWGWDGSLLNAKFNNTDFGTNVPLNITGNSATATAPQNATSFKTALATSFQDVTNVNPGTTNTIQIKKNQGGVGIDITNETDATFKMGVTAAGASNMYGWVGSDVQGQLLVLNPDNNANVAIGKTTALAKLDINGNFMMGVTGSGQANGFTVRGTNRDWYHFVQTNGNYTFGANQGDKYFFTNDGKLGINQSTPTEALHVVGKAIVTTAPTNATDVVRLTDLQSATLQTVPVSGTSQTMSANRVYIPHSASLTTFTLPTTATEGQLFQIVGEGSGGWRVSQNASQQIVGVNVATTSGTSGSVQSTNANCTITIRCTVANSKFTITSSQGTLTIN